MPSTRVLEAVDVFKDCHLSLSSRLPRMPPYQFSCDGFEEGLDSGIIIAIAFPADGYLEAMLPQDFLIIMRTILQTTIRMMNASFGAKNEVYDAWVDPAAPAARACGEAKLATPDYLVECIVTAAI